MCVCVCERINNDGTRHITLSNTVWLCENNTRTYLNIIYLCVQFYTRDVYCAHRVHLSAAHVFAIRVAPVTAMSRDGDAGTIINIISTLLYLL